MTQANPSVSQAPISINDEPKPRNHSDGGKTMDNTSSEFEKAYDAASDIRIKKFWASLASYRQSQTTIFLLMAKEKAPDEEMNEAIDEQCRATLQFLATPIGVAYQFIEKFEVVEELITKEDIVGKSRDNYPVLALASLKRDLMALDGKTLDL